MRAIVCRDWGPPESLSIEAWPTREPEPHEVTVRQAAWGVNFVDLLMVAGGYQLRPPLPFVPGLEGAGTIAAVGSAVREHAIGDAVMTATRPGAFAEEITLPADAARPVPSGLTLAEAATFRSGFSTAYHALVQGGRLQAGETALIHGAAGGTGLAAVQVAKRLGARVIAMASDADKFPVLLAHGADHAIAYRDGRFRDEVKACNDGEGVDVIFDPVGGDVFDESMRCLNWGARLVVVGFAGGRAAHARTNHVLIKGASVVGIRAGEFARRNPEAGRANMRTLLDWVGAGDIKPHISHRFRFDNFLDALNVIVERKVIGRVVLER
ncbi:MAG: NADPH:quinone oxidoreductase family protein [Pseudomonadota bacterium]